MTDPTTMASWDGRYREGSAPWELGRPASPLEAFLRNDPRAPQPSGRVLVPRPSRRSALGLRSRGPGAARLRALGLRPDVREPARGSVPERDNEGLGLWRKEVLSPDDGR